MSLSEKGAGSGMVVATGATALPSLPAKAVVTAPTIRRKVAHPCLMDVLMDGSKRPLSSRR